MQMNTNELEIWRIKNVIKKYSRAKGSGTSLITLMIKSGGQISLTNQKLTDELGAASNIKDRVNRQSVQTAITSAQHKLKKYNRTPPNGLVLLVGIAMTDDKKEKKMCEDFEPFKQLNQSMYRCDSRFHVEPLEDLLVNNDTYGFIIIDGNGLLLATVTGNEKNVVHHFNVDLPKKHGRGGQSALRFSRLRDEARHNYLTKSNEMIKKYFTKDNKPTVKGVLIAGIADFKHKLTEHGGFPYILKPLILGKLDISYGGENGLNRAIDLSKDIIPSVVLMNEKKILGEYFDHLNKETGLYCYGITDVMYGLEMGAINKLIVWDELPLIRFVNEQDEVVIMDPQKMETNKEQLTIKDDVLFLEWLTENYSQYGIDEFCLVSNGSQEGKQFSMGFTGIGGILRWNVDFSLNEAYSKNNTDNSNNNKEESESDDEFDDFC